MDLYIWLSREWSSLQKKEKTENSFPLVLLQEVFGCEEKSISEFKEELVNCFHKALPYFPGFQNNVKLSEDGKHLVLTKPKNTVADVLNKFWLTFLAGALQIGSYKGLLEQTYKALASILNFDKSGKCW